MAFRKKKDGVVFSVSSLYIIQSSYIDLINYILNKVYVYKIEIIYFSFYDSLPTG